MKKCTLILFYLVFSWFQHAPLFATQNQGISQSQTDIFLGKSTLLKSSGSCGDVYYLPDFYEAEEGALHSAFMSFSGPHVEKYKRKFPSLKKKPTGLKSYRTPGGKLFLSDPQVEKFSKRELKKYLKRLLEKEIREEVRKRFDQETMNLDRLGNDKIDRYLGKMTTILFPEENKHPERQIRLYMAMYPDIAVDIISQEDHRLRPLFCRYQHKQHNIKIAKRWGHVIVIPAIALGVTSIVIGSEGIVLVPLAVAAGATAVLVGFKDIGYGIYNVWHTEKSAYLAKRHKLIQKEMKKALKNLEAKEKEGTLNPDERELLKKVKELEKMNTDERKKQMNKLCRKVHFNRMLIAFGILNAGFNGVNLSGDPTILGSLPGLIVDWLGF